MSKSELQKSDIRIRIGVAMLVHNPFLEMILDQIGVDWIIKDPYVEKGDLYSCTLLNRPLTNSERSFWRSLLSKGNHTILDIGANLLDFPLQKARFTAPIENSDPFLGILCDLPLLPIPVHRTKKAQFLKQTVFLDSDTPYAWCGWLFQTPKEETSQRIQSFPVNQSSLEARWKFRNLTKASDPSESIHIVPYAHYRHLLEKILLSLHKKCDLPFVCKSVYPGKHDSVFLFRVDSDYADRENTHKLFSLLNQYEIRSTWFLHTEAHEDWIEEFSRYSNHEFAVHGHRHKRFQDAIELAQNLKKSYQVVSRISPKIKVNGYAEPFGSYHPTLQNILESFTKNLNRNGESGSHRDTVRFVYSSEFGFDTNNLPHWPLIQPGPLQIPIHPICPGSFSRTTAQEDVIKQYFRSQVNAMIRRHDPLIFYHHPLQPYEDILHNLFVYVQGLQKRGLSLGYLTFSEWAQWWIRRVQTRFSVHYCVSKAELQINSHSDVDNMPGMHLHFRVNVNENLYIVSSGEYHTGNMEAYKKLDLSIIPEVAQSEIPVNRSYRQRYHHLLNELLNKLGRSTQ